MDIFRKNVLLFFGWHAVLVVFLTLITFIIDPFCLWHTPWLNNHRYFNDQMMNFGIIRTLLKNPQYDTIIGVSSHFADVPLEKDDHSLNFYISSGNYFDFDYLWDKILKIKTIKNIIYSFELFWADPELNKPYLNKKNLFLRNFRFVFKELVSKEGTTNLLRWSNRWQQSWCQNAQKNFYKDAKNYKLYQNLEKQIITEEKKEALNIIFDKYVLPNIKMAAQNKVQVNFVIPPYSAIRFLMSQRSMEYIYLQRLLVEKTVNFSNVRIFSFYDCNFVKNLANYYDPHHYTPYIIRYILYSVKNNFHCLTLDNLEALEKNMMSWLKEFKAEDKYPPMDTFESLLANENNQ